PGGTISGVVDTALKFFENFQMRVRMNSGAGIGYSHANAVGSGGTPFPPFLIPDPFADNAPLPIIGFRRQPDRTLGRGELERIVQQIGNNVLHFVEVKSKAVD